MDNSKKKHFYLEILGGVLFILAAVMLYRQMKAVPPGEFIQQLKAFPLWQLAAGLGLVILNFVLLIYYDVLGFYYTGHPLKFRKIALAGFIGNTFSSNLSLSGVGASTVRLRLYSAWGISASDTAKVILFGIFTFALGFIATGAVVFILEPLPLPKALHLPFSMRPLGLIFIAVLVIYSFFVFTGKKRLKIFRWEMPLPKPALYGWQLLVSVTEWIVSAAVLYILVYPVPGLSFVQFTGIFLIVQLLGVLSQVPGGMGVLEWGMLVFLKKFIPVPQVLAGLLAFRLFYYLIPFVISIVALGIHEWIAKQKKI